MIPFLSSHRLSLLGLLLLLMAGIGVLTAEVVAPASDALKDTQTSVAPVSGGPASFAPVVKLVAPSVVTISTNRTIHENRGLPDMDDQFLQRFFGMGGGHWREEQMRPQHERGMGSGVIVSADGYILTNNHVIDHADEITVALATGDTQYPAKLVGADPKTDLAVLKIDAGHSLPVISFGDSEKAQVGDLVLAIGNPFNVGETVTMGIISARGRGLGLSAYEDFLQTDASINPGNSGGALVDATGKLIGINTAILSPSGGNLGIGFAVPINLARSIMDSIIKYHKVVRGFLGVEIRSLSPDMSEALHLQNATGAMVTDVTPDSPASAAGIKAYDVVTDYNGNHIDGTRQLSLLVSQTAPGSKADLKVLRDGKTIDMTVTVGEMSSHAEGEGDSHSPLSHKPGHARLGVAITDIDEGVREAEHIPADINGALINEVIPGSSAEDAGIKAGDVIIEIDRKPVHSASEAREAINEQTGKVLLIRLWSQEGTKIVVAHLQPS